MASFTIVALFINLLTHPSQLRIKEHFNRNSKRASECYDRMFSASLQNLYAQNTKTEKLIISSEAYYCCFLFISQALCTLVQAQNSEQK